MAIREKMSAFQEPVAGQNRFVANARTPDSAIVADSDLQPGGTPPSRVATGWAASDEFKDRILGYRHTVEVRTVHSIAALLLVFTCHHQENRDSGVPVPQVS